MTRSEFYKLVCVHNARQAGLFAIVGWVASYTVSLVLSRVISDLYLDASFGSMLAVFVILSTSVNLLMRSNCEGPRKLWYVVCIFAMICVGLYLSGEALRVQQLQVHAERMDQRVSEMVSNCDGIVFATTQNGVIRAVNPGACEFTGFGKDELIGRSLDAVLAPEVAADRIKWRQVSATELHQVDSPGWVMTETEHVPMKTARGELVPVKIYAFGLRHSVFGAYPDDVQFVSIVVEEK